MTRVEIVEVAPRDGLQNEARLLPTEAKLELIERACAAGARRIEVASFVHPERVPQMADAEAVVAGLEPREDVEFSALVLNERGYDRALAAGVRAVNTVVSATETFGERNQGMSVDEAVARRRRACGSAPHADGVRLHRDDLGRLRLPVRGRGGARAAGRGRRAGRRARPGRDRARRHDRRCGSERRRGAARARPGHRPRVRAPAALPQHAEHGRRQCRRGRAVRRRECSTPPSPGSADVLSPPRRPGTSPRRTSSTRSAAWATRRAIDLEAAIEAARWLAGELGIEPAGMVARAGGFP